jgi:hypothetical protein
VSGLNLSNPTNFQSAGVSLKMRKKNGLEILKISQHFENQVENQFETQQIYDTHPTLNFTIVPV